VVRDGIDGVDGLEGVQEVVVSTDGERVYAVSDTDDALAIFTRDPDTGLLTFPRSSATTRAASKAWTWRMA
jgi:6-phosphogluconolactonase (cycloisomerase 2 family)